MNVAKNVWPGCSTEFLNGFPYDGDSNPLAFEQLRKQLDAELQPKEYLRTWIAILCSQQKKARALLEEKGWVCLKETPSGHPETPRDNSSVNGGTLYIMFYEAPYSLGQIRAGRPALEQKSLKEKRDLC